MPHVQLRRGAYGGYSATEEATNLNAKKSSIYSSPQSPHLIYAFAHVEAWLEDYAKSNRLPSYELTVEVARLLLVQTGGQVLGSANSVPHVPGTRRTSTKRGPSARKVAMAKRPYRKASGIKLYWARMSPAERSAEVKRRLAKAA